MTKQRSQRQQRHVDRKRLERIARRGHFLLWAFVIAILLLCAFVLIK